MRSIFNAILSHDQRLGSFGAAAANHWQKGAAGL
jgi:hypothetical protein